MTSPSVTIRDLVITSAGDNTTGESGLFSQADPNIVKRLTDYINELIDLAALDHKTENKNDDPDYITRLSTHEFFFYTSNPLSLMEFTQLQSNIVEKLKTVQSGIHLILGSFAVDDGNSNVMNITPHFTSGPKPECHFLVKNNTSTIDVRYKNIQGNALPVLDASNNSGSLPTITIDAENIALTFDSMVQRFTPGNTKFITFIEICLDHNKGVATENADQALTRDCHSLDHPLSQVVISNVVAMNPKYCLNGPVLHVDPLYSSKGCRYGVTQASSPLNVQNKFGSNDATVSYVQPSVYYSCDETKNKRPDAVKKLLYPFLFMLKRNAQIHNDVEKLLALVAVEEFLECYQDINAVTHSGETALKMATQFGLTKVVSELLMYGAFVQHPMRMLDDNAVHLAARKNDKDILIKLLDHDKNLLNIKTNSGRTALHVAAAEGAVDCVQILLTRGANCDLKTNTIGDTALHLACKKKGNDDTIQLLINSNRLLLEEKNNFAQTPLVTAIMAGNIDAVRILVANGASMDASAPDIIPLHEALKRNNIAMATFLLDHGVNTAATAEHGNTALHVAIMFSDIKVVRELVNRNKNLIQAVSSEYSTALHLAIELDSLDIAKFLIENGASCEVKNNDGETALHLAIKKNKLAIVKMLINKGAVIHDNMLLLAESNKNQDMIELLAHNIIKQPLFKLQLSIDRDEEFGIQFCKLCKLVCSEQKTTNSDKTTYSCERMIAQVFVTTLMEKQDILDKLKIDKTLSLTEQKEQLKTYILNSCADDLQQEIISSFRTVIK